MTDLSATLLAQLQSAFSSIDEIEQLIANIEASDIEGCVAQILSLQQQALNNVSNDASNFASDDDACAAQDKIDEIIGLGGLFVFVKNDERTNHQKIWLRHMQANSLYPVADVDELLAIIDGTIHDEILWIMTYHDNNWIGTQLIDIADDINSETKNPAHDYHIYSWSGKHDKVVAAQV